jgi:hypothetical protein
MTEDFSGDFTKSAQYHESGNQINRLNILWLSCHQYSSSGNYKQWKWTLDCIWRELYPSAIMLDTHKKTKWVEDKNKINKQISDAKDDRELNYFLGKKEEFLRLLQDDSGSGKKWTDEDDLSFD